MTAILLLVALAAQSSNRPIEGVDPGKTVQLQRPDLPFRRDPRVFESLALGMGGGGETEAAVAESLEALARLQTGDGSWKPVQGGSRVETTCLALLAFHNAGFSLWDQNSLDRSISWRTGSGAAWFGPHAMHHQVFRRGISWLQGRQQADGFVGVRGEARSFREHAIATQLLCDVYWSSRLSVLRDGAERALAALEAEPFPSTGDDPEGAAWAERALWTASAAWLPFDRSVLDRLIPGLRLPAGGTPRKAAVDLLLWMQLRGRKRLPSDIPWPTGKPVLASADLRDWFWGTRALLRWDGSSGRSWTDWNRRMKAALLPMKPADAESWALRALTLEVYYGPWVYWAE